MSAVLDIAIGMFFVYLLLSVICSGVNEWVGALTASRSRSLQTGIRSLLNDPKGQALARDVLDHPLIQSLESPAQFSLPGVLSNWFRQFGRPQYIPSDLFVSALLDRLAPLGRNTSPQEFGDVWNALQSRLKELTDRKAEIDQSRAALTGQAAQLAAEAKINRDDRTKAREASDAEKKAEEKLRESAVAADAIEPLTALIAIAARSPNDLVAFRKNIQSWYEQGMDRISGWYKRKSQIMLTAIAAVVSLAINADGMAFLEYLNQDSTARASIAAAARDFVQNPANDPRAVPPAAGAPAPAGSPAQLGDAEARVRMLTGQLRSYTLPIGWDLKGFEWSRLWSSFSEEGNPPAPVAVATTAPPSSDQFVASMRQLPSNRNAWFLKAIGLLFSTLAMSMGASFYFELLKQLINIRQTGPPPRPAAADGQGPGGN